jgi:hypothetical protein
VKGVRENGASAQGGSPVRRLGVVLAIIGGVLEIIVNLRRVDELLGWPIAYWNVVFVVLVLIGVLVPYLGIEEMGKEIRERVYQQIRKDAKDLNPVERVKGGLEGISATDREFILS